MGTGRARRGTSARAWRGSLARHGAPARAWRGSLARAHGTPAWARRGSLARAHGTTVRARRGNWAVAVAGLAVLALGASACTNNVAGNATAGRGGSRVIDVV